MEGFSINSQSFTQAIACIRPTCIDFRHGGGAPLSSLAVNEVGSVSSGEQMCVPRLGAFSPVGLSEYAKDLA